MSDRKELESDADATALSPGAHALIDTAAAQGTPET